MSTSDLIKAGKTMELELDKDPEQVETVQEAIDKISSIDVATLATSPSSHKSILQVADLFNNFLDDVPTSQHIPETLHNIQLLLNPVFLDVLFCQRTVFHRIAAKTIDSTSEESMTIICWVDVFLAKISEAIVFIASGFTPLSSELQMSANLRNQRETDNIRAASQLPYLWNSMPDTLCTTYASPGAKRIALRILFGVFILGSTLRFSEDALNAQSLEFSDVLQKCVTRLVVNNQVSYSSERHTDQERVNFAMIICLFVTLEKQEDWTEKKAHKPHTIGLILGIIKLVLHPSTPTSHIYTMSPIEKLDPAQTILLRWGKVLPWCWKTCTEPKIADSEIISSLTANWLYGITLAHISDGVLDTNREMEIPFVIEHREVAILALLNVLHYLNPLIASLSPQDLSSSVLLGVLSSACLGVYRILESTTDIREFQAYFPQLSRNICSVFICIAQYDVYGKHAPQIKETIVSTLCLVDPRVLCTVLSNLRKDPKIQFTGKIDKVILDYSRHLQTDIQAEDLSWAISLKVILEFFTLIWNSGASGCVLQSPIASLFCALVESLGNIKSTDLMFLQILKVPVVNAFSVVENDRVFGIRTIVQNRLWNMCISSSRLDLVIASAFSYYILSCERVLDAISCAEAWDYLRDVLQFILQHHFTDDDEPLALIVAPTLCRALLALTVEPTSIQATSGWTITLSSQLEELLSENEGTQVLYTRYLREQLQDIGKILLGRISVNPRVLEKSQFKVPMKAEDNMTRMIVVKKIPGYLSNLLRVPGSH